MKSIKEYILIGNNMEQTIEIVYICTSTYKNYTGKFLESLQYFFPNTAKILKILTDDVFSIKQLAEETNNLDNVTLDIIKITDLPYPLINLGKFAYIYDYLDENANYVFYFDADTMFIEKDSQYWNNLENVLNSGKLLLSPVVTYSLAFYPDEYREDERPYRIWDMEIFKNRCEERITSQLYDKLNIPDPSYVWASTSFIAGTYNTMKLFLDKANRKVQEVMVNPTIDGINEYIIPRLFDESVANKMIYDSYIGKDLDITYYVKPYAVLSERTAEPNITFMCQKCGAYTNKKHSAWET